PACQRRVQRYTAYPEHPMLTLERTVDAFVLFVHTRTDRLTRHRLLKNHMDEYKLKIRDDSCFCSEFINGQIDVDVDEVATTMAITAQLFSYGHKAWSMLVDEYEALLESRVMQEFLSWKDAL
ncbi:unnamed protein product, partial [Phaeothamnion confervicola]